MDEQEVDDWFDERRRAIEEEFYTVLFQRTGDPVKARARFDAKYRALITQLQARQRTIIIRQERKARLQAPLRRIRERNDAIAAHVTLAWKLLRERVRKAIFDWRIRRILRSERTY